MDEVGRVDRKRPEQEGKEGQRRTIVEMDADDIAVSLTYATVEGV
ncbi:hypothetical protein [Streptomyces sp. NPDC048419]